MGRCFAHAASGLGAAFFAALASVAGVALSGSMEPTDHELATQFVAALYATTNGRPGQIWGIGECAVRAGIRDCR